MWLLERRNIVDADYGDNDDEMIFNMMMQMVMMLMIKEI